MKEKISNQLILLFSLSLITGMLLVNMQCQGPGKTDITIYSSSQDGDRLTKRPGVSFTENREVRHACN